MKTSILIGLMFMASSLYSQELDWAFSFFKPNNGSETSTGMSSNGKGAFVISGRNMKGTSLDVLGGKSEFESDHSFIAVYNENAEIQWTLPAADPNNFTQFVWNVHMDNDGNVYSLGRFSGTVDFDPGPKSTKATSPSGATYIQKFDATGKFLWVTVTSFSGIPYGVTESPNGNLLIAGKNFSDTTQLLSDNSIVNFRNGLFLLEVTPSGEIVNAGSGAADEFNTKLFGIAVDSQGNIVLCGSIGGNYDFDLGPGEAIDSSRRGIDAWIAHYDSDFKLGWHKVFGDVSGGPPAWDWVNGIGADSAGNIYAAGRFTYTTDFDPDANPGVFVFEAEDRSQSPDGFIMKYDKNGDLQWVKHIEAEKDLEVYNLVFDDGHIYIAGKLTGVGDFDPGTDTVKIETRASAVFFGQYDPDGNYEKAFTIDDTISIPQQSGVEEITQIEVMNGALYAYGKFQKKVDFDPSNKYHFLATDSNLQYDSDLYIAKWNFDTSSQTVSIQPQYNSNSFDLYPNPNSGRFTLVTNMTNEATYTVHDLLGKSMVSGNISGKRTQIDLTSVGSGLYLVRIFEGNNEYISKVLVK